MIKSLFKNMPKDDAQTVNLNITLNINGLSTDSTILKYIQKRVDEIHEQGVKMATSAQELLNELQQCNDTTNEIASDIDALMNSVQPGSISAAEAETIKQTLQNFKNRLIGVAAQYTPGQQVDPTQRQQ